MMSESNTITQQLVKTIVLIYVFLPIFIATPKTKDLYVHVSDMLLSLTQAYHDNPIVTQW